VVFSVAFSPDSVWFVSGTTHSIHVWETESGRKRYTLEGDQESAYSVAFSPNSEWLAGSGDKTIKLWNADSWQLKHTLKGHKEIVYFVAFSPNGKWLASSSEDKTVKLWDVESGKIQHTLQGHKEGVFSVAFSPNGKWLASGSSDRTVKLWALNSPEMDKQQTESQQVESKQTESQQIESQQIESQQIESQQIESQQIESQQTESQQTESQQIESQQIESQQIEPVEPEPLFHERRCESALSHNPIDNPRPLNNAVATEYLSQKKACLVQLEQLRAVHQRITKLKKQIQNDQTDVFDKKKVYEEKKAQFDRAYQFDPSGQNVVSSEKQRQVYQAFDKAWQAYQNSQKKLFQHQQLKAVTEKELAQEQEALNAIIEQLDSLRGELREALFTNLKKKMGMKKKQLAEVLHDIIHNLAFSQ